MSCSACVSGLTRLNGDVSSNVLKASPAFSLGQNISQEKKKIIPNNPKFQAMQGPCHIF